MKIAVRVLAILIILDTALLAQAMPADESPKQWARVFFAPAAIVAEGEATSAFTSGVAWEGRLAGNFGVSVEAAYLAPFENPNNGIGTFSPGILYVLGDDPKTQPFVTGGYTLFFRDWAEHGAFFGGGVNRWMGERWGLGFEVRDQLAIADVVHLFQFRVNVVFR